MNTDSQILAAAQAIHRVFAQRSNRAKDWSELMPRMKEAYLAEAKAALEAAALVAK